MRPIFLVHDANEPREDLSPDALKRVRLAEYDWSGRLQHPQFLARLYDLEELPSRDHRYRTASGDIYQHMVNNWDWGDDWVFNDDRFQLRHGSDETFLNFLAETVHPIVRDDRDAAAAMVAAYNDPLRRDGYELIETDRFGDRIIYGWRQISAYHAPTELTLAKTPDLTENAVLRRHLDLINRDLSLDTPSGSLECIEGCSGRRLSVGAREGRA